MTKPKIIYLAAFKANHTNHDMVYQDINGKRDIGGDMLDVDLEPYDIIIATPPCNYYSRANYRRETSEYSQSTKHLLPSIIHKLIALDKPFIVENVRNTKLMSLNGLYDVSCHIYEHGRHTYWTNIPFNPSLIPQENDFIAINKRITGKRGWFMTPDGREVKTSGQKIFISPNGDLTTHNGTLRVNKNVQGGGNVHEVIERWLEVAYDYAQNNNRTGESGTL